MEIKMLVSGFGAAIPKTNFGFNLFSGVYIMLRDTPKGKPYVLGIAASPSIGGRSGTIVASHINTSWMNVDVNKHPWLCSKISLIGKHAQVEIKGTLLFSGKVDVTLTVYDNNQESQYSVSKVDIESSGGQLAATSVRGEIKDMMGKTNHGRAICGNP